MIVSEVNKKLAVLKEIIDRTQTGSTMWMTASNEFERLNKLEVPGAEIE